LLKICAWAGLLAGAIFGGLAASAQTATAYSGHACVVNISDLMTQPNSIVVADTGGLPSTGGSFQVSAGAQSFYDGDLTLAGGSASVSGSGNQSASAAALQSLHVVFIGSDGVTNTLDATSINVTATATCTSTGVALNGTTQISGLVLNGQAITVTGDVNQTFTFSGFTMVINDQASTTSSSDGAIDVIGLHIQTPGCMNGIFVAAHADISCGGPGGCPPCVDPALGFGAAGDGTVLELGASQVDVTGPAGGIFGDVLIAPNGTLSMSGDEYVTGTIRLGPGAKFNNSSHGTVHVEYNADLSAEINAAYSAYANARSLSATQSYAQLDGKTTTTITGNVGVNVIDVGNVVLNGTQVYLTGPAGAKFIVRVSGKFVLTGGGNGPQIRATGGVQPKDIAYVIVGSGEDVAFSGGGGGTGCCAAIVDGTLLAPYRKIALSPGLVNGEVISGQNISIVSGSSVRCPSCH
jgi:hypothetical protein